MRRLLVMGGTSGIGEEVCRRCYDDFDVIQPYGEDKVNVRDWRAMDDLVASEIEQGRMWTHVVYSVGIPDLHNIRSEKFQDYLEEIFNVNTFGFTRLMSALARYQTHARVVVVVSDAATTPMRGSLAYCSSKAALAMAVKCAARELAPHFEVIGVSPAVVEGTGMTEWIDAHVPIFRGWTAEEAASYEMQSNPLGRRIDRREVAEVVYYALCGPQALTGSIIEVRGGKS